MAILQHPEGFGVSPVDPVLLPVVMYNKGTNNLFVSDLLEDIDKSQTVYFPADLDPSLSLPRQVPENASEAEFLPISPPKFVSTQVVAGTNYRFQWTNVQSLVLEVFEDLEGVLRITGISKA